MGIDLTLLIFFRGTLNMPKPSQHMPSNESGKVFNTELLMQLLNFRVNRGLDSTDLTNHGTVIPAQLMTKPNLQFPIVTPSLTTSGLIFPQSIGSAHPLGLPPYISFQSQSATIASSLIFVAYVSSLPVNLWLGLGGILNMQT